MRKTSAVNINVSVKNRRTFRVGLWTDKPRALLYVLICATLITGCAQLQTAYHAVVNPEPSTSGNTSDSTSQASGAQAPKTDDSINTVPQAPINSTYANIQRTALALTYQAKDINFDNVPTIVLLNCLTPHEGARVSGNEFLLNGDKQQAISSAENIAKTWSTATTYHVENYMGFGEYDFKRGVFWIAPTPSHPDGEADLRTVGSQMFVEVIELLGNPCTSPDANVLHGYPYWPNVDYQVTFTNISNAIGLPLSADKAQSLIDSINKDPYLRGQRNLDVELDYKITGLNFARIPCNHRTGGCLDAVVTGIKVWDIRKTQLIYQWQHS